MVRVCVCGHAVLLFVRVCGVLVLVFVGVVLAFVGVTGVTTAWFHLNQNERACSCLLRFLSFPPFPEARACEAPSLYTRAYQ